MASLLSAGLSGASGHIGNVSQLFPDFFKGGPGGDFRISPVPVQEPCGTGIGIHSARVH